MIERDDEIQKLLARWEAPAPRPDLDRRVWNSFGREKRAGRRTGTWMAIAAGLVVAVGIAHMGNRGPQRKATGPDLQSRNNLATTMKAVGFRPMAHGSIRVVKTGGTE